MGSYCRPRPNLLAKEKDAASTQCTACEVTLSGPAFEKRAKLAQADLDIALGYKASMQLPQALKALLDFYDKHSKTLHRYAPSLLPSYAYFSSTSTLPSPNPARYNATLLAAYPPLLSLLAHQEEWYKAATLCEEYIAALAELLPNTFEHVCSSENLLVTSGSMHKEGASLEG